MLERRIRIDRIDEAEKPEFFFDLGLLGFL